MKFLQVPFKLTTGLSIFLSVLCLITGTVTYLAARPAIMIIASIALWGLFGLAIAAAGIIGLDRVQWFLLRRAEYRRDMAAIGNERILSRRRAYNEANKAQMELIFEGRMMSIAIGQAQRGQLHAGQLGGVGMSTFPSQVINQIESQQAVLPEPDQSLNYKTIATEALRSRAAGRFIVYGGMHGGKTTLAKYTTEYAVDEIARRQDGQVFVIDPHAPKTIWSDEVTVIGGGLDYNSVANFLDWIITEVKDRYEAGCGEDTRPLPAPYKPFFVICEEWSGVIAELQTTKRWTPVHNRTFYQDARKAGFGYFLVTHEHTVGSLGLQGMGNLLNGVEYFVTLEKNAITQTYSAQIGTSFRDKAPYSLITPGPFNGPMFYSKVEVETEQAKESKYPKFENLTFIMTDEPEPSKDEAKAIEAYEALRMGGEKSSWNTVVKAAYGSDKTGKFYHDKLKKTLDKFSVDYQ